MKRALLIVIVASASHGQDGAAERGAQLYKANCAIPYCHGPAGTAGRAPRLTGHHYNTNGMFKVITWGIPGTGMPEFTTRLTSGDIADLVAYVMTLGDPTAASAPALPVATMTPEAKAGRALFFDAARTPACGSCHELDGWGVPVGPDLASLRPERSNDVRAVAIQHVITARPAGEAPFAGLLVERTATRVRVYDLTAAIPVLRTFTAARIAIELGTGWRHADAAGNYTTSELETIAGYLHWRSRQRDKGIH